MADENVRIVISATDKTRAGFASVTRGLRSVTGAIFSMRSAIAGVVGVGGLGLLVKQSLSATDNLAKTAAKIGTTTEQLSRLQYVASLSGISVEQTNMALQRLVRRTAEAAKGTGEAQGALKELGIDAKSVTNIGLDTYILELSDAFTQLESGTQDLALGFKLFDSEGVAFINVLGQGSTAIEKMYQEAEALGIVMQSGVAKQVERVNDAFTKIGYLFRGVRDQLVGALAPAFELAANTFRTWVQGIFESEGGIRGWANETAKTILTTIASIIEGFGEATNGVVSFANSLIQLINGLGGWFDDFQPIKELTYETGEGFLQAGQKLREFAAAIGTSTPAVDDANVSLGESVTFFSRLGDAIGNAVTAMPTLDQAMESFASGAMNTFTQGFADAVTGAKNFADAVKDMARSVINSLIKMLVQYYITKPLFDAITNGLGGATGGGAPAGPRAIGGPVGAGKPYMVGERGPELFVPNQSGSIVPNNQLGGGGVTVNQNINISTGVAQTVRAEVLNLMPQIAQTAKAAVAEGRLRGGSYSKSLVGA